MFSATNSNRWFWLAILLISGGLLYLLAPILMPFVAGALLAYLGDPLVDRLESYRMSRTIAVVVLFLIVLALMIPVFVLLIPLLEDQVRGFVTKMPGYISWIINKLQPLQQSAGVTLPEINLDSVSRGLSDEWGKAGGFIAGLVRTVSRSGLVVLGWVGNLVLIPVITFYLLRDWDRLVTYIRELLPRNIEPKVVGLASESDEMLGAFLRGQLTVMIALGTIYSVGLGMIGLDFALLIGMIAGLISFVPYMGFLVGIIIAGIAVMVETQDPMMLVWVGAVFTVAQMIEGMVLTPLLVGDKIGLHPVTVIFAVLAGGQLFGFFGILMALPVSAVLAVLLRHAHDSYKHSQIYRI